jgi:lipoprotein-anchoring transpeptidase ErfK/SrfK/transposase-like protein
MGFRSASIIAMLLIGLGGLGCEAFAQHYPYAYPAPPGRPYWLRPPIDADDDPRDAAALPPEVRAGTGPNRELPPQFRRTLVDYYTKEPTGTIIIDTPNTYLYLVLGDGKALRYGIGVGREGFTWAGAERISRMAEWPDWNPPETMIERQPYLPRFMAGGDGNPLGARALYLGQTLYRIHGTNQPSTIGTFVSSGCIRLTNEDIIDLYTRVKVGTRVVVLAGKLPATAAVAPVDSSKGIAAVSPSGVASASNTPKKRHKPEAMTAKLRQVEVLVSQGETIADATRQIGVTEGSYYRWRQEAGPFKSNEPIHSKDREPELSKAPEVNVDRENSHQAKSTAETTPFEE